MRKNIHQRGRFVCAIVLASLCPNTLAQIGPNPGEIPTKPKARIVEPMPTKSVVDSPSDSAFVRPAIDELLLSGSSLSGSSPTASSTVSSTVSASDSATRSTPVNSIAHDLGATRSSIPIGLPAERTTLIGSPTKQDGSPSSNKGYFQTIVALLGVILLILGLGQVYKRLAKSQGGLVGQLGAGGSAPSGIIEVIGRYPISKGMTLVVLKFDRRILLLANASSSRGKAGRMSSMTTLCELNDAEDIASILLKSRSASGDTIAQSFEQTLRQADELTDEHLHSFDGTYSEVNPVRFPNHRSEPVRTITTDEGDRAELWSSGQDSRAAAGVLRKRLASMRREQQH